MRGDQLPAAVAFEQYVEVDVVGVEAAARGFDLVGFGAVNDCHVAEDADGASGGNDGWVANCAGAEVVEDRLLGLRLACRVDLNVIVRENAGKNGDDRRS